jgi:2',3'-cyclic-nucleotide 2'-phosphodiesterase (5'-nucleotidase family)
VPCAKLPRADRVWEKKGHSMKERQRFSLRAVTLAILALVPISGVFSSAPALVERAVALPFGPPAPAQAAPAAQPEPAQGPEDGAGTLTLLHNNDGESSLLPFTNSVRPNTFGYTNTVTTTLAAGGIAAFKTLTEQQIGDARGDGNAVVNVYAGDAFLASATLTCSFAPRNEPIYDAIAQRQIPYTAHIIGNHEFDYSPDFLFQFIETFRQGGAITQPFLSANLDFTNELSFTNLIDADGLISGTVEDNRPLARSMIVSDTQTSQRFGIVGATTPDLPTISTPRDVEVTTTLTETAAAVQSEIDRLLGLGVRKIIFVSHLQNVNIDTAFIGRLNGVDLAVAGGGDELLASTSVPTVTQLLPGETQAIAGTYPLTATDAGGRTVYVVTTAGNYKYLGRLDVEFDGAGEVTRVITETSYPRRVVPTTAGAASLNVTDTVISDTNILSSVVTPVQDCLADLAATPVVTTEVLLDTSNSAVRGQRRTETNTGNLVTDAYLDYYDRNAVENGLAPRGAGNPVIAVQNGGGIRQNAGNQLPASGTVPGVISQLDTINVLSFDNFMSVITDVTPSDIKTIFERSASGLPSNAGQFLQVAGITVTYAISNPVNSRVVSVYLSDGTPLVLDGQPVAGAPSVSVVTNQFTANGGDNYPTFANNPNKLRLLQGGAALSYEQVWRQYLQSLPNQTISASDPRYQPGGQGRINFLQATSIGQAGGTFSVTGGITITVPPAAFTGTGDLNLTVTSLPEGPRDTGVFSFTYGYANIIANPGVTVTAPISITFPFTDTGLTAAQERGVKVFLWNELNGSWRVVPTIVDTENNTVTIAVNSFGEFVVALREFRLAHPLIGRNFGDPVGSPVR